MALNYQEAIRPLSYIAEHPLAAMEYVSEHRSPVIITQNDEAKAVLLDIETYQQTQKALALLRCIKIGERAAAEGRMRPAKDVFADLEKKLTQYA
ncbi:MAG: type II toxin-antitoxin system Phd/YefM family antitoxin [Spirochaetaceae bacterium]|jgi:PHD/YefM family antitoxin component YafN of YafNO toxin-antitoxin module|nr:type II toxin-antitoxin system Phd/YefM family antitoxin [Spirochaetaceae bacterium]